MTTNSPTADAARAFVARGGNATPPGRRDSTRGAPAPRRRRRGRRALGLLLVLAGVLLLADGAATVLWQEPLTSLYGHRRQATLEHRFTDLEHAPAAVAQRHALARVAAPRRALALAARAFGRQIHTGQPLSGLRIPRIGLSAVVVQGTQAGQLREGPGHYPATSLPGEGRTVAIAGHRTTFGAWFRHIDRLRPADRIDVDLPYGRFTYRVERARIVAPPRCGSPGTSATTVSSCPPATPCSRRPSGSSCSRGS